MSLYEGENPRGFWQLKIIDNPLNEIGDRVLNGYGTLHLDTSKQDTDVEDLEEQVIDDQTKQQQAKVQQMRLQVLRISFALITCHLSSNKKTESCK